jgi:DNA-directed RNA polymerase subunit RPC12/RpoP
MDKLWKAIKKEKCELEGPYECGNCGGHIMIDASFLKQVSDSITCPYYNFYGLVSDPEV